MAKVVSDEILKLKIVVNGDEAQKRILNLEMANKGLSNSLDEQRAKLKSLNYNKAKNREEIDKTKAAIAKLTAEYDNNLRKIDDEIRAMDKMSLTTGQLKRRMDELAFTMRHMNPNDPNYKLAQDELAKLDSRYRQLRSGMGQTAFSMKELSDKINQYSALITMAVIAVTTFVIALRDAIDVNNKLADAQSAVSKTTGLNIEQVRELTEAFKEFDTRTSQLDLLKIAEIGGRLGVAQNEIKDFTKEVDKVYVALGDGFSGGVEQVANSLGKLKGLYKETKDIPIAEAMNQIGSAINELGAAGAASEENIAEFAMRIGSLPDSMRPSISEALALGAAFEESGIDAERSGTAYATFVRIAAKNSEKFAQVMGKTKEEVDKLINSNPMEFFLQFAEGAKGLEATDLAKILNDLGMNDQFVSSIVTAASGNMDRFRKSIALSNEELAKATSLQKEFDKVNNNAAAIYDKIKKKFDAMYTSEAVANTLNWLVETFGKLIGAIEDTDGTMTKIRETIIFLTKIFLIGVTAVVSYNTAILLTSRLFTEATGRLIAFNVVQKIYNAYTTTATFLQNLYTATLARTQLAYAALTGNTALQTAAQARLNAVTMANPYAALIAVLMAAAAALYFFAEKTDEATKKQKVLNDVRADAAQRVAEEKAALDTLLSVAKNENLSKEQRLDAIRRLNAISPEYLGNLTLENIKTQEATNAVRAYIKALDQKAMAEAIQAKKVDLMKKMVDEQTKGLGAYDDFTGAAGRQAGYWLNDTFRSGPKLKREIDFNAWDQLSPKKQAEEFEKYMPSVQNAILERAKNIKAVKNDLLEVNKLQTQFLIGNPNAETGTGDVKSDYKSLPDKTSGSSASTTKKGTKGSGTPQKSQYQKDLEEIQKLSEKYGEKNLDLAAEIEKRKIEMMQEGFEKEKLLLEAESTEKIRNYENQKISAEEMAKLDDLIAKTKDEKMKIRLEEERAIWEQHNERLTSLQTQETEISLIKINAIREKYIMQGYKKEEEGMQKRLDLIEREKNETLALSLQGQKDWLKSKGYSEENLAKIKNWEDARKAIEETSQKEKLEANIKFLREKTAELIALNIFSPIKLTEEQLETLEQYKTKIADLVAEIAKLKNGNNEDTGSLGGRLEGIGAGYGSTDILGLTPDQWEAMFTNTDNLTEKLQKVTAAVVVLQNAFGTYAEFAKANEDAMLQKMEAASERKQTALKKQLAEGYINQETYKKLTIKNERDLEKKKAEIAYKQAKRERAMAIAQTITNTAAAIMGIWKDFPKVDFGATAAIMSGVVGALGAVQVATILSQPLPEVPGAEEGLYPVIREQDGKIFSARKRRSRSGIYSEPTLLVGEAGASMPELVVSGRDLQRIDPEITRQFMRDIDRVRGYENGMYPTAPITSSGNDEMTIRMMAILKENTAVMQKLMEHVPVVVFEKNARNGKELVETTNLFTDLDKKNKH